MKNLRTINVGPVTLSVQAWKSMPKADKTPAGYTIKLGEAEVKHPQVMLTGGGAFPAYTYLNLGTEFVWFHGHLASGTAIQITDPSAPAPKAEEPKQEAPAPEATPAAPAPAPKKNVKHPNQK